MKNKIISAILILILIIPTIVAIINYSNQQRGTADAHNTVSITLTDPDGTVYDFKREGGKDDDIMDFFLSVSENSDAVGSLPSTIGIGDFYQCVYTTTVREFGYKYYFTPSAADCYFVNGDGDSFKMSEADAKYFLSSPYAGALYENGKLPLMTISGKEASPESAEWYFTGNEGSVIKSDTAPFVKAATDEITVEGGLAMSFPIQPDSFNVTVTDLSDGNVLFNDSYDNIGALTISESGKVIIEAVAKWFEDTERTYHGEQTYKFSAAVSAPAQFYAGASEISVGDVICVTGLNVGNAEEIVFSSVPSVNYTPVFFTDGDAVQALIPFNWDLQAGEYALTFEYGGTSQTVKIRVNGSDYHDSYTNILDGVIQANGNEEAKKKAEETFGEIAKSSEQAATKYFDGEFLRGIKGIGDDAIIGGFGHSFRVTDTDITYRHTGVDFRTDASLDVVAVNSGVVLYAGYTDYSGYTVVIEHGYGLKSWYSHLSKTSVEVGAKVNRGDAVGVTGNSGFTSGSGAHVGLTVFNIPVCPYGLWDNGTYRAVPMYQVQK